MEEATAVKKKTLQVLRWTDETTVEVFGRNTSLVEGASWFGAALLPQGLDSLLSSSEK